MTPTCRELIEFLDDYIAGELARDLVAGFEWHLARCTSCTAYLVSYRETIVVARYASRAELHDLPPDLVTVILTTISTMK
jgi:hypothetical protein